jgi:electron transfer flavoprotein alpha/beta subunit
MSQMPDRHEQIRLVHANFIRQVVEMSQNPDRRRDLEALLQGAEQQGWSVLVGAVRRIARGERSPAVFAGLDEEDQVIAESILRGLQDPATLPDPAKAQDASLAAPGLAHMIHAAARGNAQALILVGNMADQMSKVGGGMTRLAGVIRPLIDGERNPARLCRGMDVRTEQLVLEILAELGRLQAH